MAPVWLPLLLLSSLLKAQETPDSTPGVMVEADNSTGPYASTASSGPPETSGFVTPSNLPTVQEDDWTPAESFLYSGDSSVLEMSRCSRAFSLSGQTGLLLPSGFSTPLRPALDALANTANFLNMIFQASDLRESTVQEDMEWYHAMVRALLEADMLIRRALLTFDADPMSAVPQLVLCASRNPTAKVQTIILQDLSKVWEKLHPPAPAPDDSWFRNFKFPEPSQPTAALSKRVLLNDLSTLDTPKWRQGDSYVTNHSGVRWADAPFLDCEDGLFVSDWMLTLSTSFYGLKPDLTPEFRGVIRVDVNIQDIDLDQCAAGDGWFADTHQCNRTTMECIPTPGQGFRLGQYCCRCKEGYFDPEMIPQDSVPGGGAVCYPDMPICLPCWPGCRSCQDGTPCWVQEAWLLRSAVLALQGVFMMLIFVSMLVAYRHRRNRRIRASGLLLLETILFGSLLLYFPVFIMYFKPSTFRCILLRWVRMLGFSIVYGTVTLKMYRVLKVFLSRTAQRVPYLSSLYLLRILGVMLMTVSWFLCAWTVGVLQNRDRNIPVFVRTNTTDGQGFNLCYLDRWDYMMAVAELLFLCWGSSLWTAVRPVPSAFHEPRYMGIAIHNELLLSSMFHLFRFTFSSLHPDWMLLLSFTHTHVTITVTLALLFIPKFLYVSKPGREEIAAEVYEDEVDLRRSGSYFNSSFHSAWSEHSGVDPDDFRDELKKLYAQLEVHKTKKMTANNPHLSKKRSSRCALGRSIIKRIAEIPESMSRQCSRDDKEGSFHTKSVIQSESSKRVPDSVTTSHKSSMKTPSPSPAMHKSQSDHYYVRERDPSLHDSMLKANAMKRTSHQSETDSLDIPLGLCKSASAHNLSIDINLLHPDHTRLQKSWSLTSTSKSSLEIFTKVTRASTLRTHSGQSLSISDQTRSALQSESFDKSDVCPWEVEQEESADKTQKHVTYANFMESEDNGPSSPKRLVCPWDNLPPVEKKPSEENEKFETDSPKPQAPVSASAPSTPRPKFTKDQRVFSFRTATSKWLSVKSAMASFDTGSKSSVDGKSNQEDSISQKSQESNSSRRPSMEKRVRRKTPQELIYVLGILTPHKQLKLPRVCHLDWKGLQMFVHGIQRNQCQSKLKYQRHQRSQFPGKTFVLGTQKPQRFSKSKILYQQMFVHGTQKPQRFSKSKTPYQQMFVHGTQKPQRLPKSKIPYQQMFVHGTQKPQRLPKSKIPYQQMFVHGTQTNQKQSKLKYQKHQRSYKDRKLPEKMFVHGTQKPQRDQDEVTENQGQLREEETPPDVSSEQVNEPRENLGRRDALCPWAMERSRSGSFTDNTSDVFTWEPENIPEEDEDDDAEFAAEALVFPPDL
ncbi:hypothetical protein PBY51_019687 [Eleginops maclovinus]|uniref:G-protein coupled receptors family 3 profile domain-containing protein n=1 Tax=Eleginops maclovinus TaxID=56733 RepID=A0AAN7XRL3_ELEMC|nr:hypothetical protein PBY51_019687 [Eleginops maclovinus]